MRRSFVFFVSCCVICMFGCQSTNPCSAPSPVTNQANCPQRPPLRQRLFGSVNKPGSCPTCPSLPPGSIPAGNIPPGAISLGGPPSGAMVAPPLSQPGGSLPPGFGPPPPGATLPSVPNPVTPYPTIPGAGSPSPISSGPSLGYSQPPPASSGLNSNPGSNGIKPSSVVLGPPEASKQENQFTAKPSQQAVFPVDIPGYAVLAENMAAGQQPFPDGIQWLRQAGFGLAINVKAPGEDDTADKALFERAGITFRSLELGAESLDQSSVRLLKNEISQSGNKPVFIYDRDGSRVGPLWFAYAVTVLAQPENTAKDQAARLGFKPETRPEWAAAIQRIIGSK